jgi:hypothetical protein
MTEKTTPSKSSTSQPQHDYAHLVKGRLALLLLRNQLDSRAATLRSQLMVTEEHQREAERLLESVEGRLASEHAAVYTRIVPS